MSQFDDQPAAPNLDDTDPSGEAVGDPFESWPSAESAEVIEETPPEGRSVEHVRGEIDVPDGYTVARGHAARHPPVGRRRRLALQRRRHEPDARRARSTRCSRRVSRRTRSPSFPVPGAFELPLAAMALAKTRRYACIVALGAIVRGETPHFDYVASECASGLQLAGDRDRRAGRVRRPDGRERRPGRGPHRQGGRGGPLGARDGRPVRPAARDGQGVDRYNPRADEQGLRNLRQEARRSVTTARTRWWRRSAASTRTSSGCAIVLNGSPTRAYVCTRCLKGGKVTKAV